MNGTNDRVYVVSLGKGTPAWSKISWRDIVNSKHRYFHPVGRRWPKKAVEYIAFRYDGAVQSIHKVTDVVTIACRSDFTRYFPEIDGEACRLAYDRGQRVPHFIYTLGPPLSQPRPIPSGTIQRANRVWVSLEALLSAATLSDAQKETRRK